MKDAVLPAETTRQAAKRSKNKIGGNPLFGLIELK